MSGPLSKIAVPMAGKPRHHGDDGTLQRHGVRGQEDLDEFLGDPSQNGGNVGAVRPYVANLVHDPPRLVHDDGG